MDLPALRREEGRVSYDNWKTTPPETDEECTEDAWKCECPCCRQWRDNYEPPEREWEPAAGDERERMAEIQRTLK